MSMPEPAGASGGLKIGYCLMVGGDEALVKQLAPIFTTLAPQNGWAHVGGVGAGHYLKIVHNGIEYSMMQGYTEGFELMAKSDYQLNRTKIADLWMHGSVVRSWLLELASGPLKEDPRLEQLKGDVQDSGEGRWMIADAIEKDVPVPMLATALFTRFRSRQSESFAERCWPRCGMPSAAMRFSGNRMLKKSASGILASLRGSILKRSLRDRKHWRGLSVHQDPFKGRTAARSAV